MQTTTLDLQEQVIEALAFDPQVTADDIAVTAQEGVVTLRGTVPNLTQKWEATKIAKSVRGVRGIADELTVDLPSVHVRGDTDIALSIERRFESNAIVPKTVKFVVKDGYVTLTGNVTWRYQADTALGEVRRVNGVKSVLNALNITSTSQLRVEDVKERIQSALRRMADADAKGIGITVSSGTVTLSGSAKTWAERDNAIRAAWGVPGVLNVEDFITVTPW